MNRGIVHIIDSGGHRKAYLDLFVAITNFQPLVGPISTKSARKLLQAPSLLFATVGRHFRRHFVVSLIRSLLGKPSCVLFLGAISFRTGIESNTNYLDRILAKIWTVLPKQKILAILPYESEPSLARVTNDYIFDPQIWDMWFNDCPSALPSTALSALVEEKRGGRDVLIFLGKKDKRKSFGELVRFAKENRGQILVVAAGKVAEECAVEADELRALGMMVEDRFISDDELLSLYAVADYVWCYYAPLYDQPSGIYGRAIQLGVKPIVRSGSFIANLSDQFGIPSIKLKMEDFAGRTAPIECAIPSAGDPLTLSERRKLFTEIRDDSLSKLRNYLELK